MKLDLNLIVTFVEIGEKKFGLRKMTTKYYHFSNYDGLILPYTYLKKNKSTKGIVDGALFDNHQKIMVYDNPTRFSLFLRSVWTLWDNVKNFIRKEKVIPLAFLNEVNFRTCGNILRNNAALNRRELTQINFLLHSNYGFLGKLMETFNKQFEIMYRNKSLFTFDLSINKKSIDIKSLSDYNNDDRNGKLISFKNIFSKINSYNIGNINYFIGAQNEVNVVVAKKKRKIDNINNESDVEVQKKNLNHQDQKAIIFFFNFINK